MRSEDILQQLSLRLRVEGASGLVEEHDLFIAQQGTGDGDALCLSFGQSSTPFAAYSIESIGEVEHEVST